MSNIERRHGRPVEELRKLLAEIQQEWELRHDGGAEDRRSLQTPQVPPDITPGRSA
jgi:hypothetical protein